MEMVEICGRLDAQVKENKAGVEGNPGDRFFWGKL